MEIHIFARRSHTYNIRPILKKHTILSQRRFSMCPRHDIAAYIRICRNKIFFLVALQREVQGELLVERDTLSTKKFFLMAWSCMNSKSNQFRRTKIRRHKRRIAWGRWVRAIQSAEKSKAKKSDKSLNRYARSELAIRTSYWREFQTYTDVTGIMTRMGTR